MAFLGPSGRIEVMIDDARNGTRELRAREATL